MISFFPFSNFLSGNKDSRLEDSRRERRASNRRIHNKIGWIVLGWDGTRLKDNIQKNFSSAQSRKKFCYHDEVPYSLTSKCLTLDLVFSLFATARSCLESLLVPVMIEVAFNSKPPECCL